MTEPSNRKAERVRIDAFVRVHGGEGQELVFRTRDLSEQGLFLYTKVASSYAFRVGSTLSLELYDEDQQVTCKVVVVRIVTPGTAESESFPTGFGVRIVELSDEARAQIAAMIARVKAGEASEVH